ncbi:hypothetical protein Patl1_02639 [Pistacia atlantica]|uniref:Uncharacterized protein n=1 Tax=Pistacia atlantica TaxID=434234 RepID=A0ACC1CDE4_9ROSI|nr:hypothetical protein Patl1_02639 [Pistacia atlantica]
MMEMKGLLLSNPQQAQDKDGDSSTSPSPTPTHPTPISSYDDLKYNLDNSNIIQFGITLSNQEGIVGGTWEFNFSDFDLEKDSYAKPSIRLVKKHGLDFDKIKKDGIPMNIFVSRFFEVDPSMTTISSNVLLFMDEKAAEYFRRVFDIEVVVKHSEGLQDGELGLSKLAHVFKIKWIGESHNANLDSLLIATAYARMMECYKFEEEIFDGFLCGITTRNK